MNIEWTDLGVMIGRCILIENMGDLIGNLEMLAVLLQVHK